MVGCDDNENKKKKGLKKRPGKGSRTSAPARGGGVGGEHHEQE
jgi:hypothetical protein